MSSGSVLWLVSPKETTRSSVIHQFIGKNKKSWTSKRECSCMPIYSNGFTVSSSVVASQWRSSEEIVSEVVLKQAALVQEQRRRVEENEAAAPMNWNLLDEAFDRCGEVCAEYAKTFYLGKLLY